MFSNIRNSNNIQLSSKPIVFTQIVSSNPNPKPLKLLEIFLNATSDLSRCTSALHGTGYFLPSGGRGNVSQGGRQDQEAKTKKTRPHRFFSPSGISSNNFSSKCCSETDQACLYVSGF